MKLLFLLIPFFMVGQTVIDYDGSSVVKNDDGTIDLLPSPGIRNTYWLQDGEWSGDLYTTECKVSVFTFENSSDFLICVRKAFCEEEELRDLGKCLSHIGYLVYGHGTTNGEYTDFNIDIQEKSLFGLLRDINKFFIGKVY